ncbi:AraC family transcriptional regulator [Emticicia sp. 21SJ11W-3]|uniref:helix-turn-helix domain-containing protein n=1 Tax=Emticicia sp. 21SJ11W-3 TaxID=2916755 RepID=UPI00209E22B0|nr:helix-turn-helix domain-containing protein [Emticicia sp. 21SJ11W-3]UTA66679.1 helix-turn-helix domain-containing protein [Emticicia sp. 21SJ11W-3]
MPFFYDIPPGFALRQHVRVYRFLNFSFTDTAPVKAYPPRPEITLAFYPRDPEQVSYAKGKPLRSVKSAIIGQQSVVSQRQVGQEFLLIQVVFQPGGFYRLTGIPSFHLTNQYLDAEAVLGAELGRLNEQLANISHYPAMIPAVENYLMSLLFKSTYQLRPIDKLGLVMLENPGGYTLDQLAKEACLSAKQLERNFNERMGINPKYFARIIRFDKAFRMKNAYPHKDWLSIALDCGYYDYQHLVRDYKEFTGATPTAFYLQDTQSPERKFGIVEV